MRDSERVPQGEVEIRAEGSRHEFRIHDNNDNLTLLSSGLNVSMGQRTENRAHR